MHFSESAKKNIDSCRFCWMCRHICPIGNVTGQERNTARARALSLSLVARDAADFSDDIIDNVYQCALCRDCTNDCATGYDPVVYTKEARLMAALEGKMPEYAERLLLNIEKTGNVYGEKKIDEELMAEISSGGEKSDTLFYLGTDAIYKTPKNAIAAIRVLRKAGIKFELLKDEPESGYAEDFLFGAADETKKAMKKCAKALNEYKTVIVYNPDDAKEFLREYKEWGTDLSANIRTFVSVLAESVKNGSLKAEKGEKTFTPQDTPSLSRELEDSESLRDVLSAFGEIKEMLLIKKDTVLCANLIMNEYMPGVMKAVAEKRWADALHVGAKTVVTASPAEYCMLQSTKPEGIELLSIEEVVL